MEKALLTFSNGETLELHDTQLIIPIVKFHEQDNKHFGVSLNVPQEIWYHAQDGLIPSICEILCNCEFFFLHDNREKVYRSSTVVTIQNL